MHALVHGRTLHHFFPIMHRHTDCLAQAHLLTPPLPHLVLIGRDRRDPLLGGKAAGIPESFNPLTKLIQVLKRMVETLTSLEGHRVRAPREGDTAVVIVPAVLWLARIPLSQLPIPDGAVVRCPFENAPERIAESFGEFLLICEMFGG